MTDEQRARVEEIKSRVSAQPRGKYDMRFLLAALDAVEAENAALRAQRSGAPWLGIYRTPQEMADALVSMRADLAKAAHWAEHGPKLREALANLTAPMCSQTRDTGVVAIKSLVVAGDDAMDRYRAAVAALAASDVTVLVP